jgi:pyridoxal phosphate enzyme (YggS family)
VQTRVLQASLAAGRPGDAVTLLAVSKSMPAEDLAAAMAAGQRDFGENYAQELRDKRAAFAGQADGPRWHFIGPVQSNKTRLISEHFQWVHSVERDRIAVRLNDARPEHMPPLNVCIQVNVSGEASKHGVEPGQELELAHIIASLPRLRLRGLMAIPEPATDLSLQRQRFALLREARERLRAAGYALDTLSMGMSDDFEAAIREGATMVRVGTAIFGPRRAVDGE